MLALVRIPVIAPGAADGGGGGGGAVPKVSADPFIAIAPVSAILTEADRANVVI